MSYSSNLTDEQWTLLEPVFNAPGKRGPKHATDLRRVVDAMLYISHTGCQWRFLPESFGPWTRVWSQFRRWSRNGTWARALTVLHATRTAAPTRPRRWWCYRIRSVDVADPDDALARVEVHRRAWAPARIKGLLGLEVTGDEPGSSYSTAKHRAVIETPGYRPELDLVTVGPDGDQAAYALGWLDDRTHSLLFEPVETDPAHSGRGLARALCAQMLRVADQLGAKEAIVGPRGDPGYLLPVGSTRGSACDRSPSSRS